MESVYSERFCLISGPGGHVGFGVPAYKRAVIKSVTGVANVAAGGSVAVAVKGGNVIYASITGIGVICNIVTYIVVYAGEPIDLYTSGTSTGAQISGYLFSDSTRSGKEAATLPTLPPSGPPWEQ